MLKVRYNGRRFPRTVAIRRQGKKTFLADRKELTLEDYDAYLLLRNNIRISPTLWEFNVVEVVKRFPKTIKSEDKVSENNSPEEIKSSSKSRGTTSSKKKKKKRAMAT